MKNKTFTPESVYETVLFYPIEIPIFYKVIKKVKGLSQEYENTDLFHYLCYLEPIFQPLFTNLQKGYVSTASVVFHVYEFSYLCAFLDVYLSEKEISEKEEQYLYDVMERVEALYYKHYSKIKKFNLCPVPKKKKILKEILKEKEKFFHTQKS